MDRHDTFAVERRIENQVTEIERATYRAVCTVEGCGDVSQWTEHRQLVIHYAEDHLRGHLKAEASR